MNTRPIIDDSTGPTSLCASFNHDASCFSIGHDSGFCVFNSDPCELRVSRDFNAGIGVTEMLGRYNFLALVGGGRRPKYQRNQVVIWDDAKQKAVIALDLARGREGGRSNIVSAATSPVLGVRLSKSRIIVILRNRVHIYAFSSPPSKISEFETADNPLGLCCLGASLLAFPGRSHGQIQVVELESGNVTIIPAHSTPLRAMALSPDGQLLATASEQGTLIRVFSTGNCARLAELRRGVDPAFIFSIAISPSSTMLAVTSDKSTLHIFDLPLPPTYNHSLQKPWSPPTAARSASPASTTPDTGNSTSMSTSTSTNKNKWGILSKLPILPRVFSDNYSFTSTHFEIGDDECQQHHDNNSSHPSRGPALGSLDAANGRPPQKGLLGWTDDQTVLVVGAGREGRWERFRIVVEDGSCSRGKRVVRRDAWKRYLG